MIVEKCVYLRSEMCLSIVAHLDHTIAIIIVRHWTEPDKATF